jgi:hypothetical protein
MGHSWSGQKRKVEEARAVVQQALGDALRRDGPQATAKYKPMTKPIEPAQVKSGAIPVVTLREAAGRLGITTEAMEAMVKRGMVKSLTAGWTVVGPTSEVERLRHSRASARSLQKSPSSFNRPCLAIAVLPTRFLGVVVGVDAGCPRSTPYMGCVERRARPKGVKGEFGVASGI